MAGAAEVVFGSEGALPVFAGVDGAGCDSAALVEELGEEEDGVRFFTDVFDDEGGADGDCEDADEEGDAMTSAVSAGVGVSASAGAGAGSALGLPSSRPAALDRRPRRSSLNTVGAEAARLRWRSTPEGEGMRTHFPAANQSSAPGGLSVTVLVARWCLVRLGHTRGIGCGYTRRPCKSSTRRQISRKRIAVHRVPTPSTSMWRRCGARPYALSPPPDRRPPPRRPSRWAPRFRRPGPGSERSRLSPPAAAQAPTPL